MGLQPLRQPLWGSPLVLQPLPFPYACRPIRSCTSHARAVSQHQTEREGCVPRRVPGGPALHRSPTPGEGKQVTIALALIHRRSTAPSFGSHPLRCWHPQPRCPQEAGERASMAHTEPWALTVLRQRPAAPCSHASPLRNPTLPCCSAILCKPTAAQCVRALRPGRQGTRASSTAPRRCARSHGQGPTPLRQCAP